MQIGELAERLDVPYREVRYVLEQGFVPPKAEKQPGKGSHRQLDSEQVIWLAILLSLKKNGLAVPAAAKIAKLAMAKPVKTNPGDVLLHGADYDFIDVANQRFVRFSVDDAQAQDHTAQQGMWFDSKSKKEVRFDPLVYFRLDVQAIAQLMIIDIVHVQSAD